MEEPIQVKLTCYCMNTACLNIQDNENFWGEIITRFDGYKGSTVVSTCHTQGMKHYHTEGVR